MKAGLDQMTAWLLAVALSGAVFGAGYGVTRLAGRGEHQDDGHGDSHGDGHGDSHGASHGASQGSNDGHSSSGKSDHDDAKGKPHSDSHGDSHDSGHGADSRGGHDDGHGGAKTKGKADGHSGGHGDDTHGTDAHGSDGQGKDEHAQETRSKASDHAGDNARSDAHATPRNNAFADEDTTKGVKWGYSGALAPNYWADLSPDFARCRTGRQQSPIDIDETGANPKLLPIRFLYKESSVILENSSLAVDALPAAGSYVEVDGERYDLKRVRFHTPSEHKVAGAPYDMEMQLFHRSADGERLHISVFFEEGSPHKALDKLWAHLPEEVGRAGDSLAFNFETLLPGRRVYFHYKGSLTTPPCTEGVKWFVLSQAVDASSKQVDQLASRVMRNSRKVLPLNGRKVVRSSR